ncbi:MAG: ADP-ribosylglycohydrolase family protein [Thermovenabulum sp.]|uniref:ADP-ribosylglycohydrolase family protein n=1 Tax=Thermovenabulum sp. TaxID=3100335 RepID=UPI003C7BCB53
MTLEILERIKGGLYGLATGDALGATVEFMSAEEIKKKYGVLKDIVGGGWLGLCPGEWTDDTEMALAVAEGIIIDPEDPIPHIGENFIRWWKSNPKDIGNTTRTVFQIWERNNFSHKEWHVAAAIADTVLGGKTAGNGALMRTLPVGIAYSKLNDVFQKSMDIARMTHHDVRAGLTSAIYSIAVWNILNGGKDRFIAITDAIKLVLELTNWDYFEEVKEIQMYPIRKDGKGLKPTGYTVDSFICAAWAFITGESFEDTIIKAVNLGGDADTIGAIAGGLAGVYWGYEAIPQRWIEKFTERQKARLDITAKELARLRSEVGRQ